MDLSKIVVGVDGSDNSLMAVQWAADLAAALGAEVIAVHAFGLIERLGTDRHVVPVETHKGEIAELFATAWCTPLVAAGVCFRRELVDGPPVQVLLRTSAAESADLIVVGSRGLGGFPELQLGSTSAQVVQHAGCPVVVIPAKPTQAS
jgi:nucleotide-binding universal stress UspA family protein